MDLYKVSRVVSGNGADNCSMYVVDITTDHYIITMGSDDRRSTVLIT